MRMFKPVSCPSLSDLAALAGGRQPHACLLCFQVRPGRALTQVASISATLRVSEEASPLGRMPLPPGRQPREAPTKTAAPVFNV